MRTYICRNTYNYRHAHTYVFKGEYRGGQTAPHCIRSGLFQGNYNKQRGPAVSWSQRRIYRRSRAGPATQPRQRPGPGPAGRTEPDLPPRCAPCPLSRCPAASTAAAARDPQRGAPRSPGNGAAAPGNGAAARDPPAARGVAPAAPLTFSWPRPSRGTAPSPWRRRDRDRRRPRAPGRPARGGTEPAPAAVRRSGCAERRLCGAGSACSAPCWGTAGVLRERSPGPPHERCRRSRDPADSPAAARPRAEPACAEFAALAAPPTLTEPAAPLCSAGTQKPPLVASSASGSWQDTPERGSSPAQGPLRGFMIGCEADLLPLLPRCRGRRRRHGECRVPPRDNRPRAAAILPPRGRAPPGPAPPLRPQRPARVWPG